MTSRGDGANGKLGLGDDRSDKLVPTQVRGELQNETVMQVAAGTDHPMCVAPDGRHLRPLLMFSQNLDSSQTRKTNRDSTVSQPGVVR